MEAPTELSDRSAALPTECLYVYGVVDAGIPSGLVDGAARGQQLSLTAVGRAAAVHTRIDPALLQDVEPEIAEGSRLAALVRRHDEVVTALALAGPVLPVRLGTLLPDEEALRQMLADAEPSVADGLDRVRDRAEWDLRVSTPTPTQAATLPVDDGGQGSGTPHLLGRRDARRRAAERRTDVYSSIAAVDEQLAGLADETVGAGRADGTRSVTRAYLVHNARQEFFLAAAQEAAAELERLGCAVALRGPLPAYSFSDVRLEAYRPD